MKRMLSTLNKHSSIKVLMEAYVVGVSVVVFVTMIMSRRLLLLLLLLLMGLLLLLLLLLRSLGNENAHLSLLEHLTTILMMKHSLVSGTILVPLALPQSILVMMIVNDLLLPLGRISQVVCRNSRKRLESHVASKNQFVSRF